MKKWMSTKDAMNILGVGATTIKRWADEGHLVANRTSGGHRRFDRSEVMRLMRHGPEHHRDLPQIEIWAQRLTATRFTGSLPEQIRKYQETLGSWFELADFLGDIVNEIGTSWADGMISAVDEHIASSRMRSALSVLSASTTVSDTAPICRLVALSGERHELGLALARLCLRKRGYETTFIGGDTPVKDLVEFILENEQRIVGVSASRWSTDYGTLEKAYSEISAACRKQGTELILGGEGAWPEYTSHAHRCHRFVDLPEILELIV